MARLAPAALMAAVIGILVGFVFWLGRDEAVKPAEGGSATHGSALPLTAPEPGTIADAPSPQEPTTNRAPALVPTAAEEDSVQVLVVDATGTPLPRVRVEYADTRRSQESARALAPAVRLRLSRNDQLWRQHFRAIAITDRDGIARWPWRRDDGSTWYVTVEHDGSYAETWVRMSALPTEIHRLQLVPERAFLVRVLDDAQQPVADVALRALHVHADGRQEPMRRRLATTDVQGLANIAHVQTWQAEVLERGTSRPVVIAPRLPGIDTGREVDLTSLPKEPLDLGLPPCGAIEFTVRNAFAEPVVGEEIELIEDHAAGVHVHTATTDPGGIARFGHVGLGRSFQHAIAHSPPEWRRPVTGPKFGGEVVRVEIAPDAAPILRGRLLRDQTPVAETPLHVASGDGWITRADVRTDGDGSFRIAIRSEWRGRELTGLTLRPMDAVGTTGEAATWRGNLHLGVGAHDLGVLVLQQVHRRSAVAASGCCRAADDRTDAAAGRGRAVNARWGCRRRRGLERRYARPAMLAGR